MHKEYDLGARTLSYTKAVRDYIKVLPRNITNLEFSKQLIRAAGSVGANYIEENESLSRKDFLLRVRLSRKECKESRYWLTLSEPASDTAVMKESLIQESTELLKILSAIIAKANP